MEKLIDNKTAEQVKSFLGQIDNPVEMTFFSTKNNCQYCGEIESLLTEITSLSDQYSLVIKDFDTDLESREKFKIHSAPVFVLAGKNGSETIDYGIRYYGLPSGHEFSSLINDLRLVSKKDSGLTPETRKFLSELKTPLHLQVFVTPTCPYCPQSVVLAHQMAMESSYVTADMIEAMEFPELSEKFGVSGVPQTTINDGAGTVVGGVHEHQLVEKIKQALAI